MYTSQNPGIDRQKMMRDLLILALFVAEAQYSYPGKALAIRLEFENMLQAGSTVTGVPDMVDAIQQYVDHYYEGTAKPEWYSKLTD